MNMSDLILCALALSGTVGGTLAGDSGKQRSETVQDVQLAKERYEQGLCSFEEVLEAEKNFLLSKRDQAAGLQDKIAVQRELVECLQKVKKINNEMLRSSVGDIESVLMAEIAYLDARRCLAYMENSVALEEALDVRIRLAQTRYQSGLAGVDELLAAHKALILHRRDLAMSTKERIGLQRDLVDLLKQEFDLLQERLASGVAEGGFQLLKECERRHLEAAEELKGMESPAD